MLTSGGRDVPPVQQKRRQMAETDQTGTGLVVRDLQHGRRDEAFTGPFVRIPAVRLAQVPAHIGLQTGRELGQRGVPVRVEVEGTEDGLDVPDGPEPLTARIPDDQPGGARRAEQCVQVSTDTGFGLGGHVRRRQGHRSRASRQWPQQHGLRGFRDLAHDGQLALMLLAQTGGDQEQRREQHQGQHLHEYVLGGQRASLGSRDDQRRQGDQSGDGSTAGVGEGGGERERDDQQMGEVDVRRQEPVGHRNRHDRHGPQGHPSVAAPSAQCPSRLQRQSDLHCSPRFGAHGK